MTKARDISKLSAVEVDATADQTNTEVKAAVEAASDSNTFTDADHSKLNAIEASADVTDTANVTSSGALMDSELTNLAAVKAINQGLVTTASPTFSNVGVGTSSRSSYNSYANNLVVYEAGHGGITIATGTSNHASLYFADGTSGDTAYRGYLDYDHADDTLDIGTGGTHSVTINSSGNVGIGTTSPDLKLDVSHGTGSEYVATFQNTADNLELKIGTVSGLLNIQGANASNNAAYQIALNAEGGNVGIGTSSPDNTLHVHTNSAGSVTANVDFDDLVVENNTNMGMSFLSPNNTFQQIGFGDVDDNDIGKIIYQHTNDSMQFVVNASERMRITSAGNVGIGENDPDSTLTVKGASHTNFQVKSNSESTKAFIQTVQDSDVRIGSSTNHPVSFYQNGGEVMRISANGSGKRFTMGTTSPLNGGGAMASFVFSGAQGVFISTVNQSGGQCMGFVHQQSSVVGSINITSSATQYATSSDYRLKENVDYTWDATTRLKQLKPARFNFIADDTNTLVDGFLAHEVSSVVPNAVVGTKDAMKEEVLYVEDDELPDGKNVGDVKEAVRPDYQHMDHSKLVPLLVKTIQELEARITALEA